MAFGIIGSAVIAGRDTAQSPSTPRRHRQFPGPVHAAVGSEESPELRRLHEEDGHEGVDGRQREPHEPAELHHDQASRIVVQPPDPGPDQLRRREEAHRREGEGLVEDEEGEVLSSDVSDKMTADDGVEEAHAENDREPTGGDRLPKAVCRKPRFVDLTGGRPGVIPLEYEPLLCAFRRGHERGRRPRGRR